MANYKPYDQRQGFFQIIDPKAFMESNRLLRAIDEFVEEHLPIESFSKKVFNDEVGAAALDPRLVTKVLFYGVATGVRSYRGIEERLKWDPSFMILAAQQVFDHSTLCRFIDRHWEALRDFFTITVYVLIDQGFITKDFLGTDGTKIKAYAGKDFTGTPEDFLRRSKKLQKKIEEILSKMGNETPDPPTARRLKDLQNKKNKIDKFLEEVKDNSDRIDERQKVNLTDRDAQPMKDKDRTYHGYNVLLTVDANHFIVGYGLYNCTADQPHLIPVVEKLRKELNDPLKNSVLAFDAGFYSASNILFLEQEGLNGYIPEGQAEDGSKKFKDKTSITSKDCTLENVNGKPLLTCPGKQSLSGKLCTRKSGRVSYQFEARKEVCQSCEFRTQCYGEKSRKHFEVERITFDSLEPRERMRNKVASDFGKAIRNRRFATGEHVNGEIKDPMRLRQFHHRGNNKVETITAITATAYNLRRLASVS